MEGRQFTERLLHPPAFTLVAAFDLCTKTVNNACNDDFGLKDFVCPDPFTEFDADYEWRTAGQNCDNCTMFFLGEGDKDDCADSGPEFKCEYTNTITWCDGTTDDPYPVWTWMKPSVSSGNNCRG
jgi:hypothetical protein